MAQFAASGQPPQEGIHEQGVEQDVGGHLHLQRVVGPAARQCAKRDGGPARRIKDGRLRIGDEGQSAIVVRVPEWDLATRQSFILVSAESDELPGEIALSQRGLIGRNRREKAPKEKQPEQDESGNGEEILVSCQ